MKSLLSLTLLICIFSTSNAYSQKKFDFAKISTSVETFFDDIFDKDKRQQRKTKRFEKRLIRKKRRKARREARLERKRLSIQHSSHQHSTPQPKPLQLPVVKEPSCSLADSMIPKCYHKREVSELKIALLYYGDHMSMGDLERIGPILQERFAKATGELVTVRIISNKVIGFKHALPEGYTFNEITDKKRLHRIWYSENVGTKIMKEVYEQYKKYESREILEELDAIVAITGAQFEGLGFASGRVSVTEYPREIAWNTEGGGRVDYISDYEIVDELIHELGHNLYLGHTSDQCQKRGMTYKEKLACCKLSDSKDDVLSYCRQRANVNESFMHGFESCNREMIESKVVPALLSGGKWMLENMTKCQ